MDPDLGTVSREEFNRLGGYVIGLTNAVRALIAKAAQNFRDRQDKLNAGLMAKLTRPPGASDPDGNDAS